MSTVLSASTTKLRVESVRRCTYLLCTPFVRTSAGLAARLAPGSAAMMKTSHLMTGFRREFFWIISSTDFGFSRAPRLERTAPAQTSQIGWTAGNGRQVVSNPRISRTGRSWHQIQQPSGIGMKGPVKQPRGATLFNRATGIHDDHTVRKPGQQTRIVSDE